MIRRIPWIPFRYLTVALHCQGAHCMGVATVVRIMLVAAITGIVAAPTGGEVVPLSKGRPMIVKRVAAKAGLTHPVRKPDPNPVATTADRSINPATCGALTRGESSLAEVVIDQSPMTRAPSKQATEQDLLAAPPADHGAVYRPASTIFVVPCHVSPRYWVQVGDRHGCDTLRHRHPVERSHVPYGVYHGDRTFGYGCHRHGSYRGRYGSFGIGFHFGF